MTPRGGVELAGRIDALKREVHTLADAARAAHENEITHHLKIVARALEDSGPIRSYSSLYTTLTPTP